MKDTIDILANIIAIVIGIGTIINWLRKGKNALYVVCIVFALEVIFIAWRLYQPQNIYPSIPTETPMPQEEFSFELAEPAVSTSSPMNDEILGNWIIVIGGGYSSTEHAKSDLQENFSSYSNTVIFYRNSDIRTAIVGFNTQADAQYELEHVELIRETAYLRELNVWCPARDFYNDYIGCR